MKHNKLAWVLLSVLSLIWGSSFILIKKSLVSFSPIQIASIRIISASLILIVPAIKSIKKLDKQNKYYIFISGLIGSFLPGIFFAMAQRRLSSSITGVLNSLTPLFIAIIALLWFDFKLTRRNKVGLALAFLGSLLLSFYKGFGEQGVLIGYVLLALSACLCYAVNLNLLKYKLKEVSSIVISSLSLWMMMIPSLIILFNTNFIQILNNDSQGFISLSYVMFLGVFGTGVALILFNRLLKISTPTFAGSVAYIIPVIAILFGVIDGEVLVGAQIAGIVVVLIGVLLINK